jgi:hypothetical protein
MAIYHVAHVSKERLFLMVLFTIATILLAANCEALLFNDGHMEVEDPMINFEENDSILPHFSFDLEQVRKWRNMLNSPEVTALLEQ